MLIGDDKNADRHNLRFAADITCTAGYYMNPIVITIFPVTNENSVTAVANFLSEDFVIYDGETKHFEITCDFTNGELGKKYEAVISGDWFSNAKFTGDRTKTFTLSKTDGVADVEAADCDITLSDGALVLEGSPAGISIFAPDGRIVLRAYGIDGVLSLDSLQKGVYVVRADFGEKTVTKSIKL